MKRHLKTIAAAILFAAPGLAFAQTDAHHPADAAAPAQAQPMSPEMMQTMMQMMQNCMGMMQMMQGGMGGNMPMMQGGMSEAMQAFMAAMSKMDMPMMQAVQSSDPDVAFVKGMIPHHQGAIDMARAVLQFGKDDQVKAWANQIIAAQQSEIDSMRGWLQQHAK
jgi:uncharacterized protein (DUF305 family)